MRRSWLFGCGVLVLVALVVRLAYIDLLDDSMSADEAVGALMTLKIARGEEFPLMFWEASYSGTFPFLLGAVGFRLVEPSLTVLRLPLLPLALVGIAATVSPARAPSGVGPAPVGGAGFPLGPPPLFPPPPPPTTRHPTTPPSAPPPL